MEKSARAGIAWAGLACVSLAGCCGWSWISAAAPLPTLVVGGLAVIAVVVAVAIPSVRRAGGDLAGRLVPGSSVWVVAGVMVMVFASGAAFSTLLLIAPSPQPDVHAPALDGSEVAARDGSDTSRTETESTTPTPEPIAPTRDPESPAARVEDDGDPEETEPSGSEPQEQAAVEPLSDDEMEIEAEVSREIERRPTADPYLRIAQRRRMAPDEVLRTVERVGEYRNQLADDVRRNAGRGVVGRVETSIVARTEDGAFTAQLSLTVTGCPDNGRLPDQDLDLLARTGLTRIAQNLAAVEVDAFRASLWYESLRCSRHSLGYTATWTREGNRLRLR